jgi:O-antigen/teichoic acid export membrane protein
VTRLVPEYRATGRPQRIRSLLSHVARYVLITGSIVGGGIFAWSGTLALWLSKLEIAGPLRVAALGVPFAALLVPLLAFTRAYHSMRATVVVRDLAVPLAFIILFLGTCLGGLKGYAPAAALVGADVLGLVLCAMCAFRTGTDLKTDAGDRCFDRRSLFGYSWVFFVTQLVTVMRNQSDTLILAFFVPASEVGIYAAVLRCLIVVHLALIAVGFVFPQIVAERVACGDMAAVAQVYRTITRWLICLSLFFVMFLMVFSEDVLTLVFGPLFRSGAEVLIVASLGYFANAATGPVGYMLLMSNHHKTTAWVSSLTTAVAIGLSLAVIPRYGILGAAAVRTLTWGAYNAILVTIAYRQLKIQPYDRTCVMQVAVALVVFGPAWLAHRLLDSFWGPAVACVAAYTALTLRFALTDEDRTLGRTVLRRMRRALGVAE